MLIVRLQDAVLIYKSLSLFYILAMKEELELSFNKIQINKNLPQKKKPNATHISNPHIKYLVGNHTKYVRISM